MESALPIEVRQAVETLQSRGYSAYLVGGCVRDLILGQKPDDWDIATSAQPEEIAAAFPKTFYENIYGTVTVVNENTLDETLRHIEVTPFRQETNYSDRRHPDKVIFGVSIEDDLRRRDFTINAIAYDPSNGQIIDPHKGQEDIKDKVIRAVGSAEERFREDAQRILRAIRLASKLSFTISSETAENIQKNADLISIIAKERVKDEFSKIVASDQPMLGLALSQKLGVLKYFIPELEEGLHVKQNKDHKFDVFEHAMRGIQHAADRKFSFHVKLGVLFHDVGKPRTRRWSSEKQDWTFYSHEIVGAKMTKQILKRLKFPTKTVEIVAKLVRNHMFFTDIEKITLSAVRRVIRNVGREEIWNLMSVRVCDRIGMGRPKESPYRLRKYESMVEEAMRAPTSVAMLKIKGDDVLRETGMLPGPKIGFILNALLEEVLEKPEFNERERLINRTRKLGALGDEELRKIGEKGKQKKDEVEQEKLKVIRKKYRVK